MKHSIGFYVLWVLLVVIIVVVAYKLVVGPEGVVEYINVRHEKVEMERSIQEAKRENLKLREEINRLKRDPSAREEILREKLKYIRDGEIHYHFVREKGSEK